MHALLRFLLCLCLRTVCFARFAQHNLVLARLHLLPRQQKQELVSAYVACTKTDVALNTLLSRARTMKQVKPKAKADPKKGAKPGGRKRKDKPKRSKGGEGEGSKKKAKKE